MKWDLDSMQWLEEGQVSADGRTVTGKYTMSETETTIPGKQTLVFVLQVYGAGNGTEIVPSFNFKLTGNDDSDKKAITGETITVSAAGKYNVQLVRNLNCNKRVLNLNYDGQSIDGRVYGYAFIIQLYNDNESKGLKGIDYPKGDISFDVDVKLQRSELGSSELEDITDIATPLLWNYKVNSGSQVISDRPMISGHRIENAGIYAPQGIKGDRSWSVYNSGNITMQQNGEKITVSVKNYDFDGIFPKYNCESNDNIVFSDNIGCFSVGYFQLIVPDNDETILEDRNYYLTVGDSNLKQYQVVVKILIIKL